MWLVVGLGNPGSQYAKNRHNIGFRALELCASRWGAGAMKEKFSGLWAKASFAGEELVLLEPQTYMNLSGDSVQPAAAFLKVEPAQIIVVHDELDLPWRDIRLKVGGGHAGHNGLRSIIGRLGADFIRVRVGVGRPPPGFKGDVADFVLHDFDGVEKAELPDVVDQACDAVVKVIDLGLKAAMNAVNTKK